MSPGPQAGSEPSAAAPGGRRASGGLGESVWARAQSSPRFALQASGRRSPESGSKPEKILKRGTYDKVAGLGQGRAGSGRGPRGPQNCLEQPPGPSRPGVLRCWSRDSGPPRPGALS